MALKLMYITNKPEVAIIAERAGVDWIFIDLEIKGKVERQGLLDTVISKHSIDDISLVKSTIKKSKVLVRINSIDSNSEEEINKVILNGADIIMLPYFKTVEEVETFLGFINKRVKTCLLLETPEAVEILDEILSLKGIDYIHIGLNDLHLGYKMNFMFELLSNGVVENICNKIKNNNKIIYGFGGIARIGKGLLPAEYVIGEHYRLESKMAILSRSFCDVDKIVDYKKIRKTFKKGIKNIRKYEKKIKTGKIDLEKNKIEAYKIIEKIAKEKV